MASYNLEKVTVHELMKEDIMFDNENNKNVKSGIEYIEHYLMLDSYAKIKNSSTEYGEFKWIINTENQTLDESIGVKEAIRNIVQIQIGTFYMPILEDVIYWDERIQTLYSSGSVQIQLQKNNSTILPILYPYINVPTGKEPPTLIPQSTISNAGQYTYSTLRENEDILIPWVNNPYSQIPFANKITIQIKEVGLQTYTNFNNVRYNYEFIAMHNNRLNGNPNFIQVKPVNGARWDEFNFSTPIHQLSSITFIFRNPDTTINFEPDVMYYSQLSITSTSPNPGYEYLSIQTQFDHKLKAGDRIYIRNFRPKNTTAPLFPEYLKNYILRNDGHVVNEVNPTLINPGPPPIGYPGTSITTAIDFGLDPAIKVITPGGIVPIEISNSLPAIIDVFIAKRRLRIPMKIKCIKK